MYLAYPFVYACCFVTTGSMHESVAASRVEKALSEVASSYQSSLWIRHGPQHSWGVQSQIWLHLGKCLVSCLQIMSSYWFYGYKPNIYEYMT